MNNLKTRISWNLNDYCKSECSYCPTKLRGGLLPPETSEYIRVAKLMIDNYASMDRRIDWTFNGGEPLDMNDIVTLLKLCRESGDSMTLHTNGGRLWMDWWAIEPYVDMLHLSYHYWQSPALIKYIIDTFQKKEKRFKVVVPIRPDHFEEDIERATLVEQEHKIVVGKAVLHNHADPSAGMFPYTREQLAIMSGVKIVKQAPPEVKQEVIKQAPLVKVQEKFETTTWHERHKETYSTNPVFTGMMCNVGIEALNIGPQGWVSGSDCNNQPLGNIWHEGWMPPREAQRCTMQACISASDRKITKF